MDNRVDRIKELTNEIYPEAVAMRRFFHQNPELSQEEYETREYVCKKLKEFGIEYTLSNSTNAIAATIYGQNREKAVAIRADMDALPVLENTGLSYASKVSGVMHACGHDMHTAILLGSAYVLKSMEDQLKHSVKLFFQPAEETIGGADQMIKEGCMDNPKVERVISLHVNAGLKTGMVQLTRGAMNAAATDFTVTVKGKSCHGAHPDDGIDPLIPACTMVTSIQSIVTRQMNPVSPCLITVGSFHSGTKSNVIPGETTFSGIIRALSNENLWKLKDSLEEMCHSIAKAHGATCQITTGDGYPVLRNDDSVLEVLKDAFSQVVGTENMIIDDEPSLGADDFAFFCEKCPCFYYSIGVVSDGATPHPLHSDKFYPDEEAIRTGILTEVSGVLNLLDEI